MWFSVFIHFEFISSHTTPYQLHCNCMFWIPIPSDSIWYVMICYDSVIIWERAKERHMLCVSALWLSSKCVCVMMICVLLLYALCGVWWCVSPNQSFHFIIHHSSHPSIHHSDFHFACGRPNKRTFEFVPNKSILVSVWTLPSIQSNPIVSYHTSSLIILHISSLIILITDHHLSSHHTSNHIPPHPTSLADTIRYDTMWYHTKRWFIHSIKSAVGILFCSVSAFRSRPLRCGAVCGSRMCGVYCVIQNHWNQSECSRSLSFLMTFKMFDRISYHSKEGYGLIRCVWGRFECMSVFQNSESPAELSVLVVTVLQRQ